MAKDLKLVSLKQKEQFWRKHIDRWSSSKISQAEYCRRNDLSLRSFMYYRGRFQKESEPVSFVQVPAQVVGQVKPGVPPLAVVFGNDCRLEVRDGFNPVTLESAVRVLRSL